MAAIELHLLDEKCYKYMRILISTKLMKGESEFHE